jgi:wyosine [tRNA(Phe)-imidazoG37] synthetase (radical SAM superfamily)
MGYIFGPVPSRRLGRSLGIDVIPPKTCSFDCIYCESGPTTRLSVRRENFADPAEVLKELDEFFRRFPNGADALTFSSAGEPTLYSMLGELIGEIKRKYSRIPLVVLTNGSLLQDPGVRKDLLKADRVVPSLDAVTPEIFAQINRPHPSLALHEIIEGLRAFRRDYRGLLHIEIMLVAGVNDGAKELSALARAAEQTGADRIELNTVVRPPARSDARGLAQESMKRAASFFQPERVEIIGVFGRCGEGVSESDIAGRILQTIERRPCTIPELAASLGIAEKELEAESRTLRDEAKLTILAFGGKEFLCLPGRKPHEM